MSGYCDFVGERSLCGNACPGLVLADGFPGQEPVQLGLRRYRDHDDSTHPRLLVELFFDDERSFVEDDLCSSGGESGDGLLAGRTDAGMGDRLQCSARICIGKYDRAEFFAIEGAAFGEHARAKAFGDFGQGWLTRLDHAVGQLIGIDDMGAEIAQHTGHSTFAAGDPASESDDLHHS